MNDGGRGPDPDPSWLSTYVELAARIEAAIAKRRGLGLPHCGDDLPDMRKLAAIMEEVSEVARAMNEETRERVRDELFDVAVAAVLSASSTHSEGPP